MQFLGCPLDAVPHGYPLLLTQALRQPQPIFQSGLFLLGRFRAPDHQHIFPLRVAVPIAPDRLPQGGADDLLMELGQFPAQRYRTLRPEHLRKIIQRGPQLMGSLVENHRAFFPPKRVQMGPAVFLVHGQKTFKRKPPRRLTGGRQRCNQGTGPRDRHHVDSLLGALGNQIFPRV